MLPPQVVEHLLAAGHHVHVVTAAPELVRTTEIASPRLHIREVEQVVLECGAPNALTVDRFPSVEKVFFVPLHTQLDRFHFRYCTALRISEF